MTTKPRVLVVVGARPQFIKAAIVSRYLAQLGADAPYEEIILHTGQHYDTNMSQVFFDDLNIPPPKHNLNVGSMGPNEQIAQMLLRLDPILLDEKPDAVFVYGDTNSTLAAGVAASRYNIPLIHVEAGERQFVRTDMPEEINRVATDHLSALCLAVSHDAMRYLTREGMPPQRLKFVGDPMYELFVKTRDNLDQIDVQTPADYDLEPDHYVLATIHRVENTKDRDTLVNLLTILDEFDMPVLLPAHPRVANLLQKWDWQPSGNLKLVEPLSYFDIVSLLQTATIVFTDSGGVTREAFFSGKPALVPMPQIPWMRLAELGWIQLIDHDKDIIHTQLRTFRPIGDPPTQIFGDGESSQHIVEAVAAFLTTTDSEPAWHYHGHATDLPRPLSNQMTHATYRHLFESLTDLGYQTAAFSSELDANTATILNQHDITVDLQQARAIAEIEADINITSTYCLMVRSTLYNVFSPDSTRLIHNIIQLGHRIGLHFDASAYDKDTNLSSAIEQEAAMLSAWFGQTIDLVSYRHPVDVSLSEGLLDTGQVQQISLYHDTGGQWQPSSPLDTETIKQRKALHILTHPIWWQPIGTAPYNAILDLTNTKQRHTELNLADITGVSKVGWIQSALE